MPQFDFTTALPAPRDDEPPELRTRIVKELRDHLTCAYQRELLLTGNEAEATRRVVAKFGDPAKLARKLWFDALREQIMSQRILVGLCSVMTVVCVVMGAVNWKVAADNAEGVRQLIASSEAANQALIVQSKKTSQALLEQAQSSNGALAERLDKLAVVNVTQLSSTRVNLKVRLVQREAGGPPAVGFAVRLWSKEAVDGMAGDFARQSETERGPLFEAISTESGVVELGNRPPEKYYLEVRTPWKEQEQLMRAVPLRIDRSPHEEVVVCPEGPLPTGDTVIEFGWPDDLRQEPIALTCTFLCDSTRFVGAASWSNPGSQFDLRAKPLDNWLVRPDGKSARIPSVRPGWPQGFSREGRGYGAALLATPLNHELVWSDPPRIRVPIGGRSRIHKFIYGLVLLSAEGNRLVKSPTYGGSSFEEEAPIPEKPGDITRWKIKFSTEEVETIRQMIAAARKPQ